MATSRSTSNDSGSAIEKTRTQGEPRTLGEQSFITALLLTVARNPNVSTSRK